MTKSWSIEIGARVTCLPRASHAIIQRNCRVWLEHQPCSMMDIDKVYKSSAELLPAERRKWRVKRIYRERFIWDSLHRSRIREVPCIWSSSRYVTSLIINDRVTVLLNLCEQPEASPLSPILKNKRPDHCQDCPRPFILLGLWATHLTLLNVGFSGC